MNNIQVDDASLRELAMMVMDDWQDMPEEARPLLAAMMVLENVQDMFCWEPGREVVSSFLVESRSWSGDLASTVKRELRRRVVTAFH